MHLLYFSLFSIKNNLNRMSGTFFSLLLLCSLLYLWGSTFSFFCIPSYISGVHHSSSSSSAFFFFCCIPSYISGVHHSSSSAAFPAISLSPIFFFCCIPSYISWVYSSSSSFPAIYLGFNILLLLVSSQLYLWGSAFWVRFLRMQPGFNPTIEVVTFHLCE